MPMPAAQLSVEDPGFDQTALGAVRASDTVRCVAVAMADADRAVLRACAETSRLDLVIKNVGSLEEVRETLAAREAHLVLVGSQNPPDAPDLVAALSGDARFLGVPVMMVADGLADGDVANALRAGAVDVLPAHDLQAERLDQAVESALQRVRGAVADQLALISNLQAENETLRRIAIRNMRLLKGQTMPLMSLSWRMMQGEQIREEDRNRYAKGLARATRNVAGLIDDTVIVAATHHAQDLDEDVDLNLVLERILRDDLGDIANSRAHVVVHPLPVLRARASQMHMLFEELLLTAVRNGRVGRVPEVEIGSAEDEDGNPVIWMLEKGLQLSARKQTLAMRGELFGMTQGTGYQDSHAWSLCQRLVERNNGQFKIAEAAENASRLTMRFPRWIMVHPAEAAE